MPLIDAAPDALARTYAQSLFELAKERGGAAATEQTLGELEDILELARAEPKFGEFLASLILPAKSRSTSIQKILRGRASDLTVNFLLVLNEKDRLSHLPSIVAAFEQLVQESFGRVEVDVYTATPIDQGQLNDIRSRLQSVLKREPVMHAYVDESLLGGLRLQIGDQLIDASVATRLRKMRERLAGAGAAQVRARADKLVSE
jgi:F-type H+-transporting ATPase subunit delta